MFQISSNEGNTHARRSKENQNILKIFRSVTSGFFICWTPLHIYLVLKSSYPTIFSDDKCLLFAGLSYYIFPFAINPFILNYFSSNYCATVNLNTYSLNVSLFLSVASTKFILQNKSQTSKLNSIGINNKGNKSKPDGWLRYILVISVPAVLDWSSQLKFYITSTHQQGWAWWEWLQFICQASKETPFFNLSLILPIFFNMDFIQTQVQSYRKPLPEKSKILKQSCFYAISYFFCSQHLCKYNLTAQKK